MWSHRFATFVAIAAALAIAVVGVAYGTFAAGGSDSSCYLSEARLLGSGVTHFVEPLAPAAPWPRAGWTFVPAGHMPSPAAPGAIVPICPPGLPLTMALADKVGVSEFLVVPFLGALAVWLTFLLGCRMGGPLVGAAAAVLTAASPILLCQVTQPMTDVPAAAWWLLVVVLAIDGRGAARPLASGLAASMAVLTRPNLLPLAVVVAMYLMSTTRVRAVALFVLGLIPGLLLLGVIQRSMYGSALASGYGPLGGIFSAGHVIPNLARYPRWLIETHSPFLALAVAAAAIRWRGTPVRAAHVWLCLALAAATLAAYLPYLVFEEWWYIRFLLPAIPLLLVLSVVVLVAALRRVAPRWYPALTAIAVAILAVWCVRTPRARLAFELGDLEHHYVEAGTFVAERLPERAALVTVKYSGSVHYYAGRPTIAWDTLAPSSFEPALAFLRDRGYEPYLLLGSEEEPVFKERFKGASPIGGLDWPPVARLGRASRVYDPRDRARFLAGENVRTEDVSSAPPKGRRR